MPEVDKKEELWKRFKASAQSFWQKMLSRKQLWFFMTFLLILNLVLFVKRAMQFVGMRNIDGSGQNFFYMMSRACGMNKRHDIVVQSGYPNNNQ